jgi:glyoxylase-like metal-dependent hydrolase (beta-lactamase superfamily II)
MLIHTLDLNFQNVPQTTAAYLVVGPAEPVLVETGPGSTLKTLKAQLARYGYTPDKIKHVLLTHIHLDHAGAAGWWAQQGAQVYVHHVGAPHLIDPSKLLASAARIYGDQMDILWGEILPAPADKIIPVYDQDLIEVGGLVFTALDTPGHAWHHHVYRLGDIAFAGDAAGLRLPQSPLIDLPAPPPEFDLEVWQQTVDRLMTENFTLIYPTHFGVVENVHQHLETFKALLAEATEFIHTHLRVGAVRDDLIKQYRAWNHKRALAANIPEDVIYQYETANPLYMSVDGIVRYWRRREKIRDLPLSSRES